MAALFQFSLDDESYFGQYKEMKCLIKDTPSDFVVHEIDENQIEADTFDTEIPPLPEMAPALDEDRSEPSKPVDNYCEYSDTLRQSIESFSLLCKSPKFEEKREFALPSGQKLPPNVLKELSFQFPYISIQSRSGSIEIQRNPNMDELESLLGESEALSVLQFILQSRLDKEDDSKHMYTLPPQEDKEKRRQLHLFFKKKYPFIHTSTSQSSIVLSTQRSLKRNRNRREPSKRTEVSFHGILRFVLKKTNIELFSLKSRLCQLLHIHERALAFAGIKDKKAVTTQFGTVRNITADQLLAACSQLRDVEVGGFSYVSKEIEIGQLWGNRFILTLRNVSCSWKDCVQNLKVMNRLGFVNYFGTQRLGQRDESSSIPSQIGCYLLQKQWGKAVRLFLEPSAVFTDDNSIESLQLFHEGDIKGAIKHCSISSYVLLAILRTINRFGYDNFKQQFDDPSSQQSELFLSILRAIPSEQLTFYVKAFQSLLFNKVLQWRVQHFHEAILPGDVFLHEDSLASEGCLREVVLPLCGYDVKLPSNEVGEYYDRILKETVGWGMEGFQKDSSPFVLPGSYRCIAAQPLELCGGVETLEAIESLDENQAVASPFDLKLSFCLRKGLYATTMITELTSGGCSQ